MKNSDKILKGDIRTGAQLIRMIEDRTKGSEEELKALYPYTGKAVLIGITGPAGSGKSSIIDHLITNFRKDNLTVGVVAVDPTSPYSGGAILGDRIRMQSHSRDPGVFIRSLATRGMLGGLAPTTFETIQVLDAMGFERIIIETVGIGQDEIEIIKIAHTIVIVLNPAQGDDIQVMKAGVLEIGDIFVVNKSDQDGADRTVSDLTMLVDTDTAMKKWKIPILKSIATSGFGLNELTSLIEQHIEYLKTSDELKSLLEKHYEHFLISILKSKINNRILNSLGPEKWQIYLSKLVSKEMDPYTIADEILETIFSTS